MRTTMREHMSPVVGFNPILGTGTLAGLDCADRSCESEVSGWQWATEHGPTKGGDCVVKADGQIPKSSYDVPPWYAGCSIYVQALKMEAQ
jgi:hypothetical protein